TAAAGTRWWPASNARATRSSPSPPRCARSPTTARLWPASSADSPARSLSACPAPLRSLPAYSASLAAFLVSVPGPIVLVGHSYGGAVVTNAATGNDNVKALGYVARSLPADVDAL